MNIDANAREWAIGVDGRIIATDMTNERAYAAALRAREAGRRAAVLPMSAVPARSPLARG